MRVISIGELGPSSTKGCRGKSGVVLEGTEAEVRACAPFLLGDADVVRAGEVTALRESLAWALRIIEHELPPQPDPCGDEGEMQSQHYFFEGMRAARALVGVTAESNTDRRTTTEEP